MTTYDSYKTNTTKSTSDLFLCWVKTTEGAGVWTGDVLRWRTCCFEDELRCSCGLTDSGRWCRRVGDHLAGAHQHHCRSRGDAANKHYWSHRRFRKHPRLSCRAGYDVALCWWRRFWGRLTGEHWWSCCERDRETSCHIYPSCALAQWKLAH